MLKQGHEWKVLLLPILLYRHCLAFPKQRWWPDLEPEFYPRLCEFNVMLLAYFSIGWDNWACKANPHWKMRNMQGKDVVAGSWTYLCYNTPYREFMLAQLHEIAQYDGVGAFWLDILRFPQKGLQACFCDGCRAKFRASGEPGKLTTDTTSTNQRVQPTA